MDNSKEADAYLGWTDAAVSNELRRRVPRCRACDGAGAHGKGGVSTFCAPCNGSGSALRRPLPSEKRSVGDLLRAAAEMSIAVDLSSSDRTRQLIARAFVPPIKGDGLIESRVTVGDLERPERAIELAILCALDIRESEGSK